MNTGALSDVTLTKTFEAIIRPIPSDTALMSLPSEEARNMIRGPEYLLYLV
jgi:hypothetical protein